MKIFPTRYSLLSATALKEALEGHYGLKDMTCRLLIHNVSDTYLLEGPSSKYIFKIYRDAHRKVEEIQGEVELLKILQTQGAQVAYPIEDVSGNYLQSFNAAEGIRYGVLFSFAQGAVVYDLNDDQLMTLGAEMAKIHNITSGIELKSPRLIFSLDALLVNPLKTIAPAFAGLEDEYLYLQETSKKVLKNLNTFNLSSFGYGYCHFDFLPKNFHFNDANITFFDFDFAGKGYLINDVATFFAHYFLQVMHKQISEEEAGRAFHVFLDGYRAVRNLSDEELKSIPYFGFAWWMFYFEFHYEHFEDWSNFFFGPKFIKERVALLQSWDEKYF
jgi:Ser/Thr protein kinase RdoA (MazF antagonist)